MVVTGADVRVVVGGAAVVAVDAGAAVGGVAGLIVVVAEPAVVGLDIETPVDDVAALPPLLPAGTDVPVGPTDVVGPFGDVAGDDPVTDAPGPVLAPRMVGEVLLRDGCAVVVVGEVPTLSVRMAAVVCENVASAVSTTVVPAGSGRRRVRVRADAARRVRRANDDQNRQEAGDDDNCRQPAETALPGGSIIHVPKRNPERG